MNNQQNTTIDSQQNTTLEELLKIITTSPLPPSDQQLLKDRIPLAPAEIQELMLQAYKEDASILEAIVQNLKKKLEAGSDPDKIQKILDEEREELTKAINEP